ncbi:hypothetical protein BGZ65_000898 [Modicella reniformis]|uniref:FHF complex subunit HOOK-interacting protein C-terminal domain-containing protein n=1 Tax=Modicella reniformis TaxID=1440133 RepID=A0A9P6M2C3_9FUNG|nr:hypothetical protein BGZ65_000898 [Modicella reniformis]
MESSFWNKLRTSIMTTPKEPPSNALQLTRFNKCWLTIQPAISTPEKRSIPVQQTEIPSRLKAMVDLLVDEESRLDDAAGDTGVCMEYLLKNNVLTKLVNTCADGDQPRGIIGETIRTMAAMINLLDDRFLVHNGVHKPTVKLLRTCCAPGMELEDNESYHEDLIDLMYILCSKIHGNPELLNIFFYDKQWLTVPERVARRLQKSRETIALLKSAAATNAETAAQRQSTKMDTTDTPTSKLQDYESKKDYEFLLFTYLSKFVHREGKAGDFARTGLLFLMELATGSLGEYILDSDFATYLTAGVGALYSQLPRKLIVRSAPSSLTNGGTTEGASLEEANPSRRANIELSTSTDFQSRLDAFLKVLEFCQDVLMRCPNPGIATNVLASFKTVFLESILYPSILECSDTDGSSVAVISYIDQILQVIEHEALVDLVVGFLMESEDEDNRIKDIENMDAFAEVHNAQTNSPYFTATGRFTLKDLVLSRLKSRSQPTVIATLKLLNTIITCHCKYSLKLLSIQKENRTLIPREQSNGSMDPYRNIPMISHHAHELDLFFALIATINPQNTQEVFSSGYEAYLRDAEGSIETHKCLSKTKEAEPSQGAGTISDEERKKQRRRSMKYGHRMDLPDSHMGEGLAQEQERQGSGKGDCCGKGLDNSTQMHRLQPSDPLLQILLGTLSHFFAHSVELNLALTGVITSLAICPHRSLEGWLFFRTTDVKKPDVDRDSNDESDNESSITRSRHLVGYDPAHPRSIALYDSDDEDTMPIFFAPNGADTSLLTPGPPSFKSFPPFFTMLKTLTQQVDYYRSEIDGFDEYLAERRQFLLPPSETNININININKISRSFSVDHSLATANSNFGNMHLSNDLFFAVSPGGDGGIATPRRPSTPTMFGSSPNLLGGSSSPRVVASGGNSGAGSRVSSPVPQRSHSKTITSPTPATPTAVAAVGGGAPGSGGSSATNQVATVKIQTRPRKCSSPSSLMSTPSNMPFLIPPSVGGKRNFKSGSSSPLAVGNSSSSSTGSEASSTPGQRYPSGLATATSANDIENQNSPSTAVTTVQTPSRNSTMTGSILQPRALWSTAGTAAGAAGSSSLPGQGLANVGTITNNNNFNQSMTSLGSFGSSIRANPLSKVIDTMMIKPLFADGFLDDSDCEAESSQLMRAKFEDDDDDDDDDEDLEDDNGRESEKEQDKPNKNSIEDEDAIEREANSDLQEPNRQRRKRANTNPHQRHGREASSASAGKKKKKTTTSLPPQQEKMVTLGQLLTNVVILEEMVKEAIAIAQVRKATGVDTVRFL